MNTPNPLSFPSNMNPQPCHFTLIVAATRSMGIGHHGTLPWPQIKSEMAYFARVTKRLPLSSTPSIRSTPSISPLNAVIMGRKTWDSIPPRFRPLKGRINVVVTRSPQKLGFPPRGSSDSGSQDQMGGEQAPLAVADMREALSTLQTLYSSNQQPYENSDTGVITPVLSRVFVIGGAEIYDAALRLPGCKRILLTRIQSTFECDTFFPIRLGGQEGAQEWMQKNAEEMTAWIGEDLTGLMGAGGLTWELEMWEREGVVDGYELDRSSKGSKTPT